MHKYKHIYQIFDNSLILLDNEKAIMINVNLTMESLNFYISQLLNLMILNLILRALMIFTILLKANKNISCA